MKENDYPNCDTCFQVAKEIMMVISRHRLSYRTAEKVLKYVVATIEMQMSQPTEDSL